MQSFKMYAPCLFGVEGILADELKRLGAEQVQAQNGRVCFSGSLQTLAAANLGLRTAERVLIEVGSFTATTFTELFDGVKALPWRQYLTKTDSFPVTGYSISSQLHSLPDCQAIMKKAVVESLRGAYGGDWFEESGPTKKIRFSIQKNRVTVGIDTSGAGLHKRLAVLFGLKQLFRKDAALIHRLVIGDRFIKINVPAGGPLEENFLSQGMKLGIRKSFVLNVHRIQAPFSSVAAQPAGNIRSAAP